jgi:uncharacterized protein YceH (UPF0502 family)
MSLELSFAERRVLGALIEKGFTTPEQYPLSLNGVTLAANQKSCRDPISNLGEDAVLETLESLRQKGLATLVRAEGSRVDRWKHRFSERLGLAGKEAAVLAELLLRGPQTDGELRQRASRMVPIETLEELAGILDALRSRPEPLVGRLGPEGRKRGVKYAHGLYPPSERPHEEGTDLPDNRPDLPDNRPDLPDNRPDLPSNRPDLPSNRPGAGPPEEADLASRWQESGALQRVEPAWTAPDRLAAASTAPPTAILEIQKEIRSLRERVEELEATFVKFLR